MKQESKETKRLVFATMNKGKLRELRSILQDMPLEILSAGDVDGFSSVEETGETFEANAELKARAAAEIAGLPVLADDSGLEVDALDGKPGVRSARYGGESTDDSKNTILLLKNLKTVPWSKRTARFRCVVAFTDPDPKGFSPQNPSKEVITFLKNPDHVYFAKGKCEGYILEKPKGHSGFGYDPVFYSPDHGKTFAELASSQKNKISHRAAAMKKMIKFLKEYYAG